MNPEQIKEIAHISEELSEYINEFYNPALNTGESLTIEFFIQKIAELQYKIKEQEKQLTLLKEI